MSALSADANSSPKFTVVSTFSGCGGSSLGYKLAGGKVLLAVEWDDDAALTYKKNFPETRLYHGDIAKLAGEDALALAGVKPGELDIFDGSPPCQGFSTAGKRKMDDTRNQLFREYARLLEVFQPKVFIMENVSGMVKGKMKVIFAEILRTLKSKGYVVSARLMNAKFFDVPQDRARMIFIGVRKDLGILPSHPQAQARPKTFGEVCWDLRGNRPGDRILPELVKKVALVQPDVWKTEVERYKKIKGNTAGHISLCWAGWTRVCRTLCKSEIAHCGIVHPDRERFISLDEAKRVGSFPDDFWFSNRSNGIARIGNAVPPNFMKAIAEHVYQNILVPAREKEGEAHGKA